MLPLNVLSGPFRLFEVRFEVGAGGFGPPVLLADPFELLDDLAVLLLLRPVLRPQLLELRLLPLQALLDALGVPHGLFVLPAGLAKLPLQLPLLPGAGGLLLHPGGFHLHPGSLHLHPGDLRKRNEQAEKVFGVRAIELHRPENPGQEVEAVLVLKQAGQRFVFEQTPARNLLDQLLVLIGDHLLVLIEDRGTDEIDKIVIGMPPQQPVHLRSVFGLPEPVRTHPPAKSQGRRHMSAVEIRTILVVLHQRLDGILDRQGQNGRRYRIGPQGAFRYAPAAGLENGECRGQCHPPLGRQRSFRIEIAIPFHAETFFLFSVCFDAAPPLPGPASACVVEVTFRGEKRNPGRTGWRISERKAAVDRRQRPAALRPTLAGGDISPFDGALTCSHGCFGPL